jgi:hypothetical protein
MDRGDGAAQEAGDRVSPPDALPEDDNKSQAGSRSNSPQPPADNASGQASELAEMRRVVQALQQQLQQQAQQQAQLQAQLTSKAASPPRSPSPGTTAAELAAIARALQDSQAAQIAQLQRAQAEQAVQTALLQSLGALPTFNGKGADTTLAASEWLQRAEKYFGAREQALRIDAAAGDSARVLGAANALQDDARRWLDALPQAPATWAEFKTAVKARYCSVPDERIRVEKLNVFVEGAARLRDKLNVQGMQAYTNKFAQLAGEVSADYLTLHGKVALLARGLPQRYAEVALKEDAKTPVPPLHEIINTVLSRAAQKEHAAHGSAASSSSGPSPARNVDAITLAAATFGWSREEATRHLDEGAEGWAPYDTGASSPSAHAPSARSNDPTAPQLSEAVAQIAALFQGKAPGDGFRGKQSQRRNAPPDVRVAIPEALRQARKEAGLCIKCGVVEYSGGAHGHNARTCKAPADTTTSVADGRKKIGSKPVF